MWAVKIKGKYLSSLFPVTFGTKYPSEAYRYNVKQIAQDVADNLNAEIEEVES